MRHAKVVIGAGFGDEGKGLLTDYLTLQTGAKVVARFNGGAQAGHTVVTPSGKRHVFGHVGSGTFAGAETMLSHDFIVNPFLFEREMDALSDLGFHPDVTIHFHAPVTTLFDMAINAAAELARGNKRHGSCGVGINETITRHLAGFKITAQDVNSTSRRHLAELLETIHGDWLPKRLDRLGLDRLSDELHEKTGGVLLNPDFMEQAKRMKLGLGLATVCGYMDMPWAHGSDLHHQLNEAPLIMEGAQGLMLDEFLGSFPHVTRSCTGMPNAVAAAHALDIETIQPIYVTRCYTTRHGAGPMFHEGEPISLGQLTDTTNITNEWQGSLRYAPLDLAMLKTYIKADVNRSVLAYKTYPNEGLEVLPPLLAVTCLDQPGPNITVYDVHGEQQIIPTAEAARYIADQIGVTLGFVTYGPTSQTVVQISDPGVK